MSPERHPTSRKKFVHTLPRKHEIDTPDDRADG
jgi:hypothetical protein